MKRRKSMPLFCEFGSDGLSESRPNVSTFYKHMGGCSWKGIKTEPYKPKGDDWVGIVRRVLIGSHGETTKFHVRYFEIGQGGNSSFEKHRHEHVVICIKGRGVVHFGKNKKNMEFLDTVYISPNDPHQLSNPYDEPFGFLCIVNAKRDRPKIQKSHSSKFVHNPLAE